jgi:hypothetical protein
MTGTMITHHGYSYTYRGKNISVRAHPEKHDKHTETQAEYYVAFELERQGWNVGLPLRRTQEGFDLYAEKDGLVLRVQVKGRTAQRGINDLPRDPRRSFNVLVCVLLRGHRQPETFVVTADELEEKFRHKKTKTNRWNPFPQPTLYLNRWEKLEELRRSFIGHRR